MPAFGGHPRADEIAPWTRISYQAVLADRRSHLISYRWVFMDD